MIKIIIFCDTFKHFDTPIKEYLKRLGDKIELIKLKPSKQNIESKIISDETNLIINKLQKEKGYKIYLDVNGKNISTNDFLNLIELNKEKYANIIFVIGGAYGLDIEKINNLFNYRLSFGNMTFPHIMVLLILLEQIYRIDMIKKGSSYNH